jgi:HEPN domain-containing protein
MDVKNSVRYWLELSEYDLETAKIMNETKRFLYVGFMCHQTIEKIFKAYYIQRRRGLPPHTHNLAKIAKSGVFYDELSDQQKDVIDMLEPLNIEARYPTHKERILKELNEKYCSNLLKQTEALYLWIKEKL